MRVINSRLEVLPAEHNLVERYEVKHSQWDDSRGFFRDNLHGIVMLVPRRSTILCLDDEEMALAMRGKVLEGAVCRLAGRNCLASFRLLQKSAR
jgi:hypothetical protein